MKNELLTGSMICVHEGLIKILQAKKTAGIIGQQTVLQGNDTFELGYAISGDEILIAELYLAKASDKGWTNTTGRANHNLKPEQVSLLKFKFDLQRASVCPIRALAVTRPEFEGRGLASALSLERDIVIEDIMVRHRERFVNRHVYSEIIDMAVPNLIDNPANRTGWSSRMATKLGYKLFDPYGVFPIYRKVFQ